MAKKISDDELIEIAGGELTNSLIEREKRPGITISEEQFRRMNPETIIISDATAWPAEDFISYCSERKLDVPAVVNRKVFGLYPFRTSTNPDWILGLMRLANIIHPGEFCFDLQKEADEFYMKFYGIPFEENGRWGVSQKYLRHRHAEGTIRSM